MKKKAFTLIEILLVVAIICLLSSLTVPIYQSFQVATSRQTFSTELISNLRRVQLKCLSSSEDSNWGINLGTTSQNVTIFKGSDFSSRDQAYDEIINIPPTVSLTDTFNHQIIYSKLTGLPNASGTITLHDTNNQNQEIIINPQGTVN
jgi:prepilin-type N-terminal cleavage/methylation domain-containing protein